MRRKKLDQKYTEACLKAEKKKKKQKEIPWSWLKREVDDSLMKELVEHLIRIQNEGDSHSNAVATSALEKFWKAKYHETRKR